MILKLILAIAIIIAAFSFMNSLKKLTPAERRSRLLKGIAVAVIIGIVIGAFTGRVPIAAGLVALGATAMKFGLRWGLPLMKIWFAKTGGNATFRSQYLVVSINVSGSDIQGKIIRGEFEGKALNELSDEQLKKLHQFFNEHDKKSYYILSAYIRSRGFTQNQQYQQQNNAPPPSTQTSREEALEILGFNANSENKHPSKKEIIQAHRQLMSKLHPDKGGNDYLAAKVNAARETLLKEFNSV